MIAYASGDISTSTFRKWLSDDRGHWLPCNTTTIIIITTTTTIIINHHHHHYHPPPHTLALHRVHQIYISYELRNQFFCQHWRVSVGPQWASK